MKNKVILFYGIFDEKFTHEWVPYGPMFVAATLKDAGFEPIIIHEYGNRDYESVIRENADDLVFFGVSAMSGTQITRAVKAIRILRKYNSDAPTLWGGAHATAVPINTLASPYVDFVYTGFAKTSTLTAFTERLQRGASVEGIPNLLTKNRMSNRSESDAYQIEDHNIDYDGFPRLNWEDYDFSYLISANKVINYTASTGCPGSCTFCSWGGRHAWSPLHLDTVLEDITYLVRRYGIKSVWFSDASLTPSRRFVLGLAAGLIERKLDIYWRCCGRVTEVKNFTSEDFALMEKSGMDMLFIGTESVHKDSQKLFNKIYNPDTLSGILDRMRPFQIKIILSFIFGIPGAPIEEIELNRSQLDEWKGINPYVNYEASFFTPYPGTPLADMAAKCGYVPPLSLEEYGERFSNRNRGTRCKRDDIDLPWFSRDFRDRYIARYYELFPDTDKAFYAWAWRDDIPKIPLPPLPACINGLGQ